MRLPESLPFSRVVALACSLAAPVGCVEPEPEIPREQLPLSVALDYVYRHPEYVIADPESDTIESTPPTKADAKLGRRLAGDWVARTLREYDDDDAADPLAWAWRSVVLTRMTMISQREPGVKLEIDDCLCDEGFEDLAFARLVRGLSNCDGINHTLAMLLWVDEPGAQMHQLNDSPDGEHEGGHTLASIPGDGGRIFTDAWADFGVMVLSASVSPGVQAWDELEPSDAPDHGGLYELVQYELVTTEYQVQLDYDVIAPPDDGPDLTIPAELPPLRDARDAYLRGRVFELYGLEAEALELYEQAKTMACAVPEAPLCQLSRAFIARSLAESELHPR
jgi:hypothetical protein